MWTFSLNTNFALFSRTAVFSGLLGGGGGGGERAERDDDQYFVNHFVYSDKTFTGRWYALFMYMLQLCSMFCTSYNMRGSVVSDITHMRQCCKWLVKRLDENIRILQHFKIK